MADYYGSETVEEAESKPEGSDENTFLAPKSAFKECKEGDTKKVKVVAVYEDEVELAYVDSDKKEEPKEETSDDRMQRMAV